jgi:hypothetical protein
MYATTLPTPGEFERARWAKVIGATALASATIALAGAPADAAQIQSLSASGLSVSPLDEAGADVILAPAAGTDMTVTVRPAGCRRAECKITATASNVTGKSARPASAVVPLNGATVESVSEQANGAPLGVQAQANAAQPGLQALAAVSLFYWSYSNDKLCSGVPAGCTFWNMTLGSSAWCDSDGWCWGTRSRYSHVGDINCASGGKGFSIDNNDCSFHVDPSKTSLYANYSGKVSALVSGFPIHEDHYIHHHYQLSSNWVVVG